MVHLFLQQVVKQHHSALDLAVGSSLFFFETFNLLQLLKVHLDGTLLKLVKSLLLLTLLA